MSNNRPLKKWRKLSEELVAENPWWKYSKDTFEIPDGTTGEYHYVDSPGSVMIVPVRSDGRIILVRQYRYLNERESYEFPGGGIQSGHTAMKAATEELREEAGVEAGTLEKIGEFNPFNGVTNELCSVYVARGLHDVLAEADATEEFDRHLMHEYEIDALITEGHLWDGMTLAAWNLYKLHTPTQHEIE
jgi:ADP-ribose pyrophosphatase